MKKKLLAVCFAMLALPSMADDESLAIYMSDGSAKQTFAMSDIGKLTFGDSDFTVTTGKGATPFAYGSVRKIVFEGLSSGIGTVVSEDNSLKAYYRNGFLGVDGWPQGRVVRASVYGIDGSSVMSVDKWDGTPISVSGLNHGVYIFKVGNSNIKFVKQ